MKNYKVKAIKNFTDSITGQFRVAQQSEFVVSEERYNQLLERNAIELIEIIEDKKERTNNDGEITINNEIKINDKIIKKEVKKTSKKKSK